VATVALLANLSQGGMENWSAVYMRSTLDLSAFLGASAVAIFHSAMLVGRLGAAGAIGRFGRPATLRAAGLLAAAGMAFALSVETPALVLAGILAVGLSLAAVAPIAFSLAGDAAGGKMGQASSVVTTVSYGGLLLGPALIGGLADVFGLRTALVTVVVASLLVTVFGFFVRTKHPSSDDSPAEEKANGARRRRRE
jgi:MFS family permease